MFGAERAVIEKPPLGFDEAFFAWLERVSEALSVEFASRGCLPEADISRLEQQLGFPLPQDIRRFYTRFTPWGNLRDWTGWDDRKLRIRNASGVQAPLVPIDHRSYSSNGWDVVAAVESPSRYEVVEYRRRTQEIRKCASLRSYFIGEVLDEVNLCSGAHDEQDLPADWSRD